MFVLGKSFYSFVYLVSSWATPYLTFYLLPPRVISILVDAAYCNGIIKEVEQKCQGTETLLSSRYRVAT